MATVTLNLSTVSSSFTVWAAVFAIRRRFTVTRRMSALFAFSHRPLLPIRLNATETATIFRHPPDQCLGGSMVIDRIGVVPGTFAPFIGAPSWGDDAPYRVAQPIARYWHADTLLSRDMPGDKERARELLSEALCRHEAIGMAWHTRQIADRAAAA